MSTISFSTSVHHPASISIQTPDQEIENPGSVDWGDELKRTLECELNFLQPFFSTISEEQKTVFGLYYMNLRDGLFSSEQELYNPGDRRNTANDLQEMLDRDRKLSQSNNERTTAFDLLKILVSDADPILVPPTFHLYELIKDLQMGKDALCVECSKEEILSTYESYNRLILLRPLKYNVLFIGCGWGKCRMDLRGGVTHKKVDTVDIDIGFNPSVIAFWGDPQQSSFFANRYSLIYDEGPAIIFSETNRFLQCCTQAFIHSGNHCLIIGDHIADELSRDTLVQNGYRLFEGNLPQTHQYAHYPYILQKTSDLT